MVVVVDLCEAFESVMKSNYYAQDSEIYHNVVIMTDRDDDQSEGNIINDLMVHYESILSNKY